MYNNKGHKNFLQRRPFFPLFPSSLFMASREESLMLWSFGLKVIVFFLKKRHTCSCCSKSMLYGVVRWAMSTTTRKFMLYFFWKLFVETWDWWTVDLFSYSQEMKLEFLFLINITYLWHFLAWLDPEIIPGSNSSHLIFLCTLLN